MSTKSLTAAGARFDIRAGHFQDANKTHHNSLSLFDVVSDNLEHTTYSHKLQQKRQHD
jgi:hypothetical protein